MKEQKWKDVIVAWANGHTIQYTNMIHDTWEDLPTDTLPNFHRGGKFRIKPKLKLVKNTYYLGHNKHAQTSWNNVILLRYSEGKLIHENGWLPPENTTITHVMVSVENYLLKFGEVE